MKGDVSLVEHIKAKMKKGQQQKKTKKRKKKRKKKISLGVFPRIAAIGQLYDQGNVFSRTLLFVLGGISITMTERGCR